MGVTELARVLHRGQTMNLVGLFHSPIIHLGDASRTKVFHTYKVHAPAVLARNTNLLG